MPGKLRQVLPHGVMLAAALALYGVAARIDVETGGRISPAAWPKAILVFMALLCAWELGRRLFSRAPAVVPVDEGPVARNPVMLAGGIALVLAYVLAAPWLGFFLSTAIFLAVFPWVGGWRRPIASIVIALVGSFTLVVIFMRVAYVSLPLGAGPFRELSLGLMRLIGVS